MYYSDAHIVAKEATDILAAAANENDKAQKNFAFKNNGPFISCISKIISTLVGNAENLEIFMPMYNLLEYSKNYLMKLGSWWNYYRDEFDDVNNNASDGKPFEYKIKLVEKTPQIPEYPDGTQPSQSLQPAVPALNLEVTIPLKYLSNFQIFLYLPLINCEIELDLSWKKTAYFENIIIA